MILIDVSWYQGVIDWQKVKDSGITHAYIKMGGADWPSLYIDNQFFFNVISAREAGILVGFYWFFSGRHPVGTQISKILDLIDLSGLPDLPFAVDIEDTSRNYLEVDFGIFMADELERKLLFQVIIYTGAWWWDERWLKSEHYKSGAKISHALWVASYTDQPIIPKGWQKCLIQQYTDRGVVPGISGDVDLNKSEGLKIMTRGQPRIDYGRISHVAPADVSRDVFNKIVDAAFAGKNTIGFSYDDAGVGDLTNRKAILWDIPEVNKQSFVSFYAQYYSGVIVEFKSTSGQVITPPPPAVISNSLHFGWNCLSNGGFVRASIDNGATAVTIINDFLLGTQEIERAKAENRPLTVMRRRYLSSLPALEGGEVMADRYYEGGYGGGVYLTFLNECDVLCYGSVAEIEYRAKFDNALGKVIKARGGIYAAGGFSVGTPDYTNQEICDTIRRVYAPGYNRGEYAMNVHLYQPQVFDGAGNLIPMSIWYGLRYKFLFEKCGFDPDPKLLGIYADEIGQDEGLHDGVCCGLYGHNYDANQGQRFYEMAIDAWRGDMVINGVAYPSPVKAVTGFQMGDSSNESGHWGKYDHQFMLDRTRILANRAAAPRTRELSRISVPVDYGISPTAPEWTRKIIIL